MSKIVSRECRFVFHVPKTNNNVDTHVIKEILHYADGSSKKNLRILENFKRPFWTTKEHFRNHKQKKESEDLERLLEGNATESDLYRAIAVKLGSRYVGVSSSRTIRNSPYVYGTDINSRTHIKKLYLDKFKITPTPYEVCIFDIEADVITNEITVMSIATTEKIFTVITKPFLQNKIVIKNKISEVRDEVINKLKNLFNIYIPKTELSKRINIEYLIVEDELVAIRKLVNMLHNWKPDIVAAWNLEYDMGKLLSVLKKHGVDPTTIFCDPNIPGEIKRFKYIEGSKQKVKSSGGTTPIRPEDRWHTVDCTASFYWLCAMTSYRQIRIGGKTIPGGFGLNNVLGKELGESLGKLKFKDRNTELIKGVDWHKYMTANRPLEYVIYNQWDVMSVLELDDKTKDLKQVLPMLAGLSNFDIFKSGPRRIVDALHFYYLENNRVLSTKNPMSEEKDSLGLKSWIVLLPSCRISDKGIPVLSKHGCGSNVRQFVYDSDQISGYPSNTQAANVSLDTTVKELLSIEGKTLDDFRTQNINLLFGQVNSISYASEMFGVPTIFDIMKKIDSMK